MHLFYLIGLVILEAWYGPEEQVEGFESLDLNVTIPIQVLVRKSQLYIPGRRSKVRSLSILSPHITMQGNFSARNA